MLRILSSLGFLSRIFSRMGWGREKSGTIAKERLRLVLIHDQANVSPELLETLRGEIIEVISRYMEIDTEALEMGLEQRNGSVALAANIPIVRLKREQIAAALKPPSPRHPRLLTPSAEGAIRGGAAGKAVRRVKKYHPGKTRSFRPTPSTR